MKESEIMESAQSTVVNPELSAIPERIYIPARAMPRQRVWLHVLLFLLTICTTVWVGRMLFGSYAQGRIFSIGLLSILTAHEFGHYFTLRKYRVPASLPYFIPLPFPPFGTFGAVIRMSPQIPHRRALFDIAAAGPLAGFILALPLTYAGILRSAIVQKEAISGNSITLGDPLLFRGLEWLAHGTLASNFDVLLHPLAYAGWAGMFVTALNLLPVGQLDGGHISQALFGSRSRLVAFAMFFGLGLYSIVSHNKTWIFLLILLLLMGIQHPRSMDDGYPIGLTRQILGVVLAVIFITCFSLMPITY